MTPKGNGFLRWIYARWVQILALFGLLGHDGRPSATKIWCAIVIVGSLIIGWEVACIIALAGMFGRPTIVAALCSWRGMSVSTTTRSTVTVRHERDPDLGIDPA